ncbi:Metallo-dependent phosphatase-like protein [Chlamydoabsidia padenii]|nr:Metallo-dependent phosphatase-like protein [Chlamydoabsidia padenii]
MHIDESYLPGATIESDCHRLPKPYQLPQSNSTAGTLGSPGAHCDSPIELAQQTLNWIKKEWKHKLDFVVWTGDNARRRKRKHIYKLNEKIQQMMLEAFWPTPDDPRVIPLVPSLGNNDIHPHNYISGDGNDHGILSFYAQLWHPWIPQDQQLTFQSGGYFAVNVGRQLRVLSLNTMYFYAKNDAVRGCHRPGLAQKHMQWFEQQLIKARSESVKVYVMGHVPPSPRDYRPTCFQEYTRISAAFPDTVRGHFFGHLNMDHFLMYDGRDTQLGSDDTESAKDDDQEMCINRNIGKYVDWLKDMYSSIDPPPKGERTPIIEMPLVVVQVSPSVLPVYLPSVRIYQYEINENDDHATVNDRQQNDMPKPHGTLLSYKQYFSNITEWDQKPDAPPLEYQLEYDTRDEYGLDDLTADSYFRFAKEMMEGSTDNADSNLLCHQLTRD